MNNLRWKVESEKKIESIKFNTHQVHQGKNFIFSHIVPEITQFPSFQSSICRHQTYRVKGKTPHMKFSYRKYTNPFREIFSAFTRELLERSNHARWKSRHIELAHEYLKVESLQAVFSSTSKLCCELANMLKPKSARTVGQGAAFSFGFIALFRDPQRGKRAYK